MKGRSRRYSHSSSRYTRETRDGEHLSPKEKHRLYDCIPFSTLPETSPCFRAEYRHHFIQHRGVYVVHYTTVKQQYYSQYRKGTCADPRRTQPKSATRAPHARGTMRGFHPTRIAENSSIDLPPLLRVSRRGGGGGGTFHVIGSLKKSYTFHRHGIAQDNDSCPPLLYHSHMTYDIIQHMIRHHSSIYNK